jgi:hypothetical protein
MKYFKIASGLLLIMITLFTGCKKYIEFDPHSEYMVTEIDFLKTEADYRAMVVSCYSPMQWITHQPLIYGDLATTNSVSGGASATDQIIFQNIDDYTLTSATQNAEAVNLWRFTYEGINRVNYLVEHKDQNPTGQKIDFAGKDALYGEIYFIRAYEYFMLAKNFGDAIVFTDKRIAIVDFGKLQKSTKAEVYKQIELDLNTAIAVLPNTASQKGRITKYAAQALLGKVLLYENKLSEAAAMLENVISGPFSLVADFGSQFLITGENGSESVFEVQYSNNSPYWNWAGRNSGQGNYAVWEMGVIGLRGAAGMPYADGGGYNLPTRELYDAFAPGDTRRDATCFDIEAYKTANPALNVAYSVTPYRHTGYYSKKYLPMIGQTAGQPQLCYSNNIRTIRFADILLMAAEANVATNAAKAQGYLDRVRDRAFGDNLHRIPVTKQAIWDERRLEFAMEGEYFYDLVRTGQAATKIPGFKAGKNEVFPIPWEDVENFGITQNPGY